VPRECEGCGTTFVVSHTYRANRNRQRFCSTNCGAAFRQRERRRASRSACVDCGTEVRRAGAERCSDCYRRWWRGTPEGRARRRAANIAYAKRNPEKRRQWVHTYLERIGWRVPDLQALRAAINAVDAAVAQAEGRRRLRGSGQ
jgi:hypothetical protein